MTTLAVGVTSVLVVLALGIADGNRTVPVTAVVVGPLVAGIIGRPRPTVVVGAVALAAGVVMSSVDDLFTFRELRWRLAVIVVVTGAAVGLASLREKRAEDLGAAERAHDADLAALFKSSAVAMMLLDANGVIVDANAAMGRLLGVAQRELVGHEAGARVHPDDRRPEERAQMLAGGIDSWEGELRLLHRSGEWRWVRMTASLLHHARGEPGGVLLQIIDITENKEAEAELATIISSLREAVLVYDTDGVIRALNPAAQALYGLPADRVGVGRPLPPEVFERIVAEDEMSLPTERLALQRALAGDLMEGEVRGYEHPEGRRRWYSISTARFDLRGEPRVLVSMIDITDRYVEQRHLHHQVLHDPLTGLANRRALIERLGEVLEEMDGGVAVMFIDLDHFKSINDESGHDVGDQILVHVANQLSETVRPGDLVSRLAGDEFVVVCARCPTTEDANHIAQRLLAAVAGPAVTRAGVIRPSASIGIFHTAVSASRDADEILQRADGALYEAKAAGRGTAVIRTADVT